MTAPVPRVIVKSGPERACCVVLAHRAAAEVDESEPPAVAGWLAGWPRGRGRMWRDVVG